MEVGFSKVSRAHKVRRSTTALSMLQVPALVASSAALLASQCGSHPGLKMRTSTSSQN
jgi:hypothetical protein